MSVAAYNAGTAGGTWLAGLTLESRLGAAGPALVGTVVAALTLVPALALASARRRRDAVPAALRL
jgi:DHA1 family inner membrane transport protein